jgi:hypothetical protein
VLDHRVHDVIVEKVLGRDATATYPRCTAGRNATGEAFNAGEITKALPGLS